MMGACGRLWDLRSSTAATMMAQLLPPQPNSERISQLLPTVKCSSCNSPVAISDLADHVCPPMSSAARTPPPLQPRQSPPARPANTGASQPPPGDPARVRTPSNASNAHRPTPPAVTRVPPPPLQPLHVQPPVRAAAPRIPAAPQTSVPSSVIRQHPPNNRSHSTSPRPFVTRSNTPSTPSVPSPHVPQSSAANVRLYKQPPDHPQPQPPNMAPYYPEDDIDTSTGGEAGMAGVGRRGFAAVARAAMFTANYQRRVELPRFLDIDAASRGESVTVLPIEAVTLMCCFDYSSNRNAASVSRFFPFSWPYFSVSSNTAYSRRQNPVTGSFSIRNACHPFACVKSVSRRAGHADNTLSFEPIAIL